MKPKLATNKDFQRKLETKQRLENLKIHQIRSKILKMEEQSPLRDHLLLQQIFSNLTIRELKAARLVCRVWGEEGALNFRHRAAGLSIHVNPPHMTQASRLTQLNLLQKIGRAEERTALRDFLTTYKLPHTLHLSLLDFHPWLDNTIRFSAFHYICEDEDGGEIFAIGEPFAQQHNNYDFAASLLAHYLRHTSPFIKELRLEMMLKEEKDFKLLETILEIMEVAGLEVLSLDIAVFNPELLQTIKLSKDHSGSKIKTIAIRLLPRTFERLPDLDPPGPLRLLSLFPNASFIDLIGWRPIEEIDTFQIRDKTAKFLDAVRELGLKLDGIHAAPETPGDMDAILNYCRTAPLKGFYLNVYWKGDEPLSTINTLEGILVECGQTLERFELTWRATDLGRPALRIPRLPKLKSLTYTSKFISMYEQGFEGNTFESDKLQELFGFKELFADCGKMLHFQFPALESLSLILVEPREAEQELWAEIFPPENNGKCISSKIQTLVVTFAGECDSEEIQKFPRSLFPKLRHFRHGKWAEEGDKLYVCHHEYDAGRRLIRKWSWLAAVKRFMGYRLRSLHFTITNKGNYFWTIREKFRVRLGDDGFWDTGYDIERPELQYSCSDSDDLE